MKYQPIFIFAVALLAAQSIDSSLKQDDWQKVTNVYIRLIAGVKHEPIVVLKSKIADLDAEVTIYERKDDSHAHDHRVGLVRQALSHLDTAVKLPAATFFPESLWPGLNLQSVSVADMDVSCDHVHRVVGSGEIGISSTDIQGAHIARAIALFNAADGATLDQVKPFVNLESARRRCKNSLIEIQWTKTNETSIYGEFRNFYFRNVPVVDIDGVMLGVDGEELGRLHATIRIPDFKPMTWKHYKIPLSQRPLGWDGKLVRVEVTDVEFSHPK